MLTSPLQEEPESNLNSFIIWSQKYFVFSVYSSAFLMLWIIVLQDLSNVLTFFQYKSFTSSSLKNYTTEYSKIEFLAAKVQL